jgi:MFS-type transporter involved in bile tolerance (Atg22 family)
LHAHAEPNLNGAALSATTHCLTGCAIGEVLGMALAEAFGWSNVVQIVVAVALAFVFGYALTMGPVLRAGVGFRRATQIALAADTISIVIMEAVDNGFVLVVPGAIDAGLADAKFWWSIALGFALAFGPAFAANRSLIQRGRGHAVAHVYHRGHGGS